jgi:alpha-ketoglutarate-dependent taurine dioxygenase
MRTAIVDTARGFPLVIERDGEPAGLVTFAREHRDLLNARVREHGAVLLRGFETAAPEAFAALVTALGGLPLDYVHGNSPRTKLTSANVYTSTEYPPEFPIPLHNEMSYASRWPRRLFLHCVTAPTAGGRTPIADSREILRRLPGGVRERFTTKGVLYAQNLHGGMGLGRSWQDTYETADAATVEGHLRDLEVDFEWTADGGLRTRQRRPATLVHPELGEEVWFNQADQWHWSGAGPGLGEELVDLLGEDDLPTSCSYGDGSPIALGDLAEVRRVSQECAVRFDWRPGDLMMLDNMRLAHGREPYSGQRRILLAMD